MMSLLSLLGWKSPGLGVCCADAHDALRRASAMETALRRELANDRTRHFATILGLERETGALETRCVRLAHQAEQAEWARECAIETACRMAGQVTRLEAMLAVHGVQVPAVDHGEPT